jgi:hypothetical protein
MRVAGICIRRERSFKKMPDAVALDLDQLQRRGLGDLLDEVVDAMRGSVAEGVQCGHGESLL